MHNEMGRPGRERTLLVSSTVLTLDSGMLYLYKDIRWMAAEEVRRSP